MCCHSGTTCMSVRLKLNKHLLFSAVCVDFERHKDLQRLLVCPNCSGFSDVPDTRRAPRRNRGKPMSSVREVHVRIGNLLSKAGTNAHLLPRRQHRKAVWSGFPPKTKFNRYRSWKSIAINLKIDYGVVNTSAQTGQIPPTQLLMVKTDVLREWRWQIKLSAGNCMDGGTQSSHEPWSAQILSEWWGEMNHAVGVFIFACMAKILKNGT
ncbi:uncharacterized protein [Physcomitrium patens]